MDNNVDISGEKYKDVDISATVENSSSAHNISSNKVINKTMNFDLCIPDTPIKLPSKNVSCTTIIEKVDIPEKKISTYSKQKMSTIYL